MLPQDIFELWNDTLDEYDAEEEDGYFPTSDSLVKWLNIEILRWLQSSENTLLLHHDIRNQAFGESLDPAKLNELGKWESLLDRKLERTLSMLIKLKELRPEA